MIHTIVKNIIHNQGDPSIIQLSREFSNFWINTRQGTCMVHIKG